MKKKFLFCLIAFALITINVKAQQVAAATETTEKKEPNALTKVAVLKLTGAGVSNINVGKAFPVFFEYYTDKQKIDSEIASTNTNDLTEAYEKIISTRDDKLKEILSEAEMKNFKKKLEKELLAEEKK